MQLSKQQRFLELLETEYSSLEKFALSMTRNRESARELVCETVAIAYEQFDDIQHPRAFLSYLFTIASRSWYKQKAKQKREIPTDVQSVYELYDGGVSAEDAYDIQVLNNAIDELPVALKEVFVMAEVVGLTHKEISEALGITVANCKVRVFRARFLLRIALGIDPKGSSVANHRTPIVKAI